MLYTYWANCFALLSSLVCRWGRGCWGSSCSWSAAPPSSRSSRASGWHEPSRLLPNSHAQHRSKQPWGAALHITTVRRKYTTWRKATPRKHSADTVILRHGCTSSRFIISFKGCTGTLFKFCHWCTLTANHKLTTHIIILSVIATFSTKLPAIRGLEVEENKKLTLSSFLWKIYKQPHIDVFQ